MFEVVCHTVQPFSVSSRSTGALREDTKNGCIADYVWRACFTVQRLSTLHVSCFQTFSSKILLHKPLCGERKDTVLYSYLIKLPLVNKIFTHSLMFDRLATSCCVWQIPRGLLPYISHIGMCCPKGYGLWDFLVWKRVCTLPILVWNRVWFSREL